MSVAVAVFVAQIQIGFRIERKRRRNKSLFRAKYQLEFRGVFGKGKITVFFALILLIKRTVRSSNSSHCARWNWKQTISTWWASSHLIYARSQNIKFQSRSRPLLSLRPAHWAARLVAMLFISAQPLIQSNIQYANTIRKTVIFSISHYSRELHKIPEPAAVARCDRHKSCGHYLSNDNMIFCVRFQVHNWFFVLSKHQIHIRSRLRSRLSRLMGNIPQPYNGSEQTKRRKTE